MAVNINVPSQVKTYANLAAFPATGALKTIYIAEDTNKTYRWTGSVYVEVSGADFSGYVPTTRTLTINGTTQDLSADRTFTISTGITIGTTAITSGVVGRVLFQGAGNVVSQSANLFWDDAANRLIIGGSTASNVRSNTNEFNIQRDGLTVPTGGSQLMFNLVGNGQGMTITNQNGTTYRIGQFAVANVLTIGVSGNSTLNLFTSGNVGVGTTSDAGFKLDVNGTARVQGQATIQTLTVGLGGGARSNNTVLGLSALPNNTTGNFNVAIGPSSLAGNTTGTGNISIGHFAAVQISTGINNVALGREALSNGNSTGNVAIGFQTCNTATGTNNVVIGLQSQAGNFNGSIVLGVNAAATASNQFVVGSSTTNAGTVTSEVNVSTQVWNVIINGVARKILLA